MSTMSKIMALLYLYPRGLIYNIEIFIKIYTYTDENRIRKNKNKQTSKTKQNKIPNIYRFQEMYKIPKHVHT